MCTLLYSEWINGKAYRMPRGTLLTVTLQLKWEESLGGMDTHVDAAECLRCSPETITTLSVNWIHPNTNKK